MMKWESYDKLYYPAAGEDKKKNRRLAATLLLVYIMLFFAILMQPSDAKQDIVFADQYIQHVVTSGETLWGISKYYRPDADPRQIVFEIQKVNGITPVIRPGQVIWVPEEAEFSYLLEGGGP